MKIKEYPEVKKPNKHEEAHIPLEEWMKWKNWFTPK